MAYTYTIEHLLAALYRSVPTLADAVAVSRRSVEYGLLSVGLKLHCLGSDGAFNELIEHLGGRGVVIEINLYRRTRASLCWVLPPVGNARTAVLLLEAIGRATGFPLFNNDEVQIQVCSPGRLTSEHAAILAVAFYLGSDILRRYNLDDFTTTFSRFEVPSALERGRRILLYDAGGTFDRDFMWWDADRAGTAIPKLLPRLPFAGERTDVLTGRTERDVYNINLVATLLCHLERDGYWGTLGECFKKEFRAILRAHLLDGLLTAPWIRDDEEVQSGDYRFRDALAELTTYAFEDVMRANRLGRHSRKVPQGPSGILWEIKQLLDRYRNEVVRRSRHLDWRGEIP